MITVPLPKSKMTVKDAAEAIGCNTSRVCQLLIAGTLTGEKLTPNFWVVDASSVRRYALRPRGPGRPRSKDPRPHKAESN
jgi:hypothetical protein